eukprot:129916-Karenia_brevis.AAC.1
MKRAVDLPSRTWSPQESEMIEAVAEGVSVSNANVKGACRFLKVSGGPGTGKTEAVIKCATDAARKGERVLIACP